MDETSVIDEEIVNDMFFAHQVCIQNCITGWFIFKSVLYVYKKYICMPSVELAMWKYFLEIQPGGVKFFLKVFNTKKNTWSDNCDIMALIWIAASETVRQMVQNW